MRPIHALCLLLGVLCLAPTTLATPDTCVDPVALERVDLRDGRICGHPKDALLAQPGDGMGAGIARGSRPTTSGPAASPASKR